MAPKGYTGARGKLLHGKKLKSKISCQTPFKVHPYNVLVYIFCCQV